MITPLYSQMPRQSYGLPGGNVMHGNFYAPSFGGGWGRSSGSVPCCSKTKQAL